VTKVPVKISPTRMAWREVRRYTDVLVIDQLGDTLEERELMAALRLYGLFCASGQLPRATARYDVAPDVSHEIDDELTAEYPVEDALIAYRRLLRGLSGDRGVVVDLLMRGHPPGWRMGTCRAGLAELADGWGL
jgi:hypothetical protein